jgi:hypothetical protein
LIGKDVHFFWRAHAGAVGEKYPDREGESASKKIGKEQYGGTEGIAPVLSRIMPYYAGLRFPCCFTHFSQLATSCIENEHPLNSFNRLYASSFVRNSRRARSGISPFKFFRSPT